MTWIAAVAGGAWLCTGLAKVLLPGEFHFLGFVLPWESNMVLGALEVLMAGLIWRRTSRRAAAVVASSILFCALLTALVSSPAGSCGCLGRIRIHKAQQIFMVGTMLAITSASAMQARHRPCE